MTAEPDRGYLPASPANGSSTNPWQGSDDPDVPIPACGPSPAVPDKLHVPPAEGGERVHPSEPPFKPPTLAPWDVTTIARRLQLASNSMGVPITLGFAERMASEGLKRASQIGLTKVADTVMFFVEPPDAGTLTVLGWADRQSYLDRFKALRLVPSLATPPPPEPECIDGGGPGR